MSHHSSALPVITFSLALALCPGCGPEKSAKPPYATSEWSPGAAQIPGMKSAHDVDGSDEQGYKKAPLKCSQWGYYQSPYNKNPNPCINMATARYEYDNAKRMTYDGTTIAWFNLDELCDPKHRDDLQNLIHEKGLAFEAIWGKWRIPCIGQPRWRFLHLVGKGSRVHTCRQEYPFDYEEDVSGICSLRRLVADQNPVEPPQIASFTFGLDASLGLSYHPFSKSFGPSTELPDHWPVCEPYSGAAECNLAEPQWLGWAGMMYKEIPYYCPKNDAPCSISELLRREDGTLVPLYLWQRIEGHTVYDSLTTTSTNLGGDLPETRESLPGRWERRAEPFGYIYDLNVAQTEDETLKQHISPLYQLYDRVEKRHAFATEVPDCGFELVRQEGFVLTNVSDWSGRKLSSALCRFKQHGYGK